MPRSLQTSSLAPSPVVWSNWPLRDEPASTRLAALVTLVLAATVIRLTGDAWLGLLAVTAQMVAMWRMLVPIEYHLGSRGLRQSVFGRTRTIHWSQISVIEVRRHGILLYPDRYFGPLRAMRGTYVPWCTYRDDVLRLIAFYAPAILINYYDMSSPSSSSYSTALTLEDTADHEPAPPIADDSTGASVSIGKMPARRASN